MSDARSFIEDHFDDAEHENRQRGDDMTGDGDNGYISAEEMTRLKDLTIIQFGIFWTFGTSWFNIGTMIATRSIVPHVGTIYMDKDGKVYYCEMQFANGHIGPRPIKRLMDWQGESWRRSVDMLWLPVKKYEAQAKWAHEFFLKATIKGYAKRQLIHNLTNARLRWDVPRDPKRLTCCEHSGMIMAYETPEYDVRSGRVPNIDTTWPGYVVEKAKELKSYYS